MQRQPPICHARRTGVTPAAANAKPPAFNPPLSCRLTDRRDEDVGLSVDENRFLRSSRAARASAGGKRSCHAPLLISTDELIIYRQSLVRRGPPLPPPAFVRPQECVIAAVGRGECLVFCCRALTVARRTVMNRQQRLFDVVGGLD